MKLKDYLLSKVVFICYFIIFTIVLSLFLIISNIQGKLILFIDISLLLIIFGYFILDYIILNKRLTKLAKIVDEIDKKYLISEVLPTPISAVERQYFDIMKIVSRDAIKIAENSMKEKEDYCEYVEKWIHEIKTPLTAISLILQNGADIPKLKNELKRAENNTDNILYYARLKKAEKDIVLEKFNVRDAIDDSIKHQMEILISAGISIDIEGDFEVISDTKAFAFILQQLLINCAKYAPKSEIHITAINNTVTVKDNGIGIPSYEIPRVTDKGFTGVNGRNNATSTGMGLYIVKELCDSLGIELTIQSTVNEYTAISLTFPNLT